MVMFLFWMLVEVMYWRRVFVCGVVFMFVVLLSEILFVLDFSRFVVILVILWGLILKFLKG